MLTEGRRAALGTPRDLVRPLAGRCVDLRLDDAERALRPLAATPWVVSTTQLGDSIHVLLRPEGPSAEEAVPLLEGELTAAGLAVERAGPGSPNLEDVFVALLAGERLDS